MVQLEVVRKRRERMGEANDAAPHELMMTRAVWQSFLAIAAVTVLPGSWFVADHQPLVMFREGCIEEDEDQKCRRDCNVLDVALNNIGDPTMSGLAKANFRQMRMFTVIALRQARMSYYASLVAASVGLLVLTAGGAVTVGLTGMTAKVAAGAVTAFGAAMSGFLSAAFLKTYWM